MRPERPSSLRRNNILAPVSLVCGILAWTLLPVLAALAAMFCGHVAYAKSKRLDVGGRGIALAGMILGYTGLAAAAVLLGAWAAMPEGKSPFGGGDAAVAQTAAPPQRPSEKTSAQPAAAPKPAAPVLWNVNIPAVPENQIQGIATVRLGRRHHQQSVVAARSPRGENVYWIGAAGEVLGREEDTDFAQNEAGMITVTPLSVDLTDHAGLGSVAQFWQDTAL